MSVADQKVDYEAVKAELRTMITEKGCAPILVRLSWHDAGTYCAKTKTGGARGCMRFAQGESTYDANKGLDIARKLLEPIHHKYSTLSHADFWSLAAAVAVEVSNGPKIEWRAGRSDASCAEESVADGRLPDATKGADHIRDIFYRMGFSDREIVALSGAHTLGRCHPDRSGFDGPWTADPLKFDNSYFVDLLSKEWVEKKVEATGNVQFVDKETGKLMMLPTDLELIKDEKFKVVVEEYAKDQQVFFNDFSVAFKKLQELGVNF